jgi:superoxide dismutase, Fe-Mn family
MSHLPTRRMILTNIVPSLALAGTIDLCTSLIAKADDQPAPPPVPAAGPYAAAFAAAFKDGEYSLPPLPYAPDALEPHIDAATMTLHHDKHHKAYVDGLNKAVKSLHDFDATEEKANLSLLTGLQEDLSFNAGGHFLHTIFWNTMAANAGGDPQGALNDALARDFGSLENFRARFTKAAASVKGSGWALLAYEPLADRLMILQLKQHDLQLATGVVPLLPLDIWEHAYYLKYHNVRAEYIKAWWNVVNWPAVADAFAAARAMHGHAANG